MGVFAQRLLTWRTVAPAWACLHEQGRSYSSQAIVVVVVRRPLVANKWHFPSKRRNPELIDVVFSLFVNKAKPRPNRATTTITGVGVAAPCATTTTMVPRSKHYYYDCQCRSHGNGRLIPGKKRCRPCAPLGIDRHREFGALCRRAAVTTSANLNYSLLARGFGLEVIEATLADAERVCRSLLPLGA